MINNTLHICLKYYMYVEIIVDEFWFYINPTKINIYDKLQIH